MLLNMSGGDMQYYIINSKQRADRLLKHSNLSLLPLISGVSYRTKSELVIELDQNGTKSFHGSC